MRVGDEVLIGSVGKPGGVRSPRLVTFARQPASGLCRNAMVDDEPHAATRQPAVSAQP